LEVRINCSAVRTPADSRPRRDDEPYSSYSISIAVACFRLSLAS